MSFENFERRQAQELLEQGDRDFDVDSGKTEPEANPTLKLDAEAQEKQNKEIQEKISSSKSEINNLEQADKANEKSAQQNIDAQLDGDFWPPMGDFDDSDEEVASQIGHTEGGTSLDNLKA